MATLTSLTNASANLTLVRAYTTGTPSGKRAKVKQYTFAAGASDTITVGGATNKILATDLGLTRIERVSSVGIFTTSSGAPQKVVPMVPALDGSAAYAADAANATAANHEGIADFTVGNSQTGTITVEGV